MRKFKTESKKLLDLMINSIYTNREIFLRELISNASDAVDKLYFKSLTDSTVELGKDQLCIRVAFDSAARTVTVSDNGIGMTKDELDRNLGIIAHSDSLEFKNENLDAKGQDLDIIGQFGVGFYSSFMVAKNVRVVSRAWGSDEVWVWESDGIEGYTLEKADAQTARARESAGTDIILTLKENTDEERYDDFLSEYGIKNLIKRYSNYVRYPVQMMVTKTREVPDENAEGENDEQAKPTYESYQELETINSMIPIWKRKKSEVSDEEYNEFYKTDFHDYVDPVRTFSIHAEGALSYDALLFIPGRAPYDLYSKDYKKGLALYSSNVLIMEKCEDLLPDYYNFVRGVVDSLDLTLNISRETLQHNNQLRVIAKRIEKKIGQELRSMRDSSREEYEKFFEMFGRGIEFGIYTSYGMKKDDLADLLLFYSAREQRFITLDEYAASAGPDQKVIYYAAGESVERLGNLPIVKTVLGKGFDVLLCTRDVDDFCLSSMFSYTPLDKRSDSENGFDAESAQDALEFKNVASGELDLASEEEKQAAEVAAKDNEALFDAIKEALEDEVCDVRVSSRLSDAPACVAAAGPVSFEMERVFAQSPEGADYKSERVLELNIAHPVFETLRAAFEKGDTEKVARYANLLYNQALLVEGLPIDDPVAFVNAITELM